MAKNKKGFGKFLIGLGIGAGLSALYTTSKGKEIRKQLKIKLDELVNRAKEVDLKEVSEQFLNKVEEIRIELEDLDKEKVIKLATKKGEALKSKAEDLIKLAKEKGTPILEDVAGEVKEKTILVIKDVLKRLEKTEK